MTDSKKPELTPQQQSAAAAKQQTTDSAQIETAYSATDFFVRGPGALGMLGFGSGVSLGKTSFEGVRLNDMLDLLDNSNPSDLENAGTALVGAKTALNKAAEELAQYIQDTEWKGESGTEFTRYGKELVSYTFGLGTFANAVGEQMKVASEGLTSVRNSKPPRDGRLVQKQVEDFALPERRDDNPEYAQAVKAEGHRQEAINQMNRLASFYTVSEHYLAGQEPPRFPKALEADVPRPTSRLEDPSEGESGSGVVTPQAGEATVSQPRHHVDSGDASDTSRVEALPSAPPVPGRDTAVEIDSVKAPPAPPTAPTPVPTAPLAPGPSGPTPPSVPPVTVLSNPVRKESPWSPGAKGVPRTTSGPTMTGRATGAGRSSGDHAATGRQGPVGRPSGPTTGRVGSPTTQGPAVGRPGGPGQSAAGRMPPNATSGPRAGRADGIVGGTPQRPTTGSAGSRIPRGTVIGAEGRAPGRASAASPSRSGVVGANTGSTSQRSVGKGTPSVNGVVGNPRSGSQAATRPTSGGSGGQRKSRKQKQERDGSTRPDYLTEDEQTWTAQRRGAVPPVID
ncbi:hypothetical protein [Streptomyces sp. NPDC059828]|uniref:hypothetical protein n=1 Tax=Streptomyces sp. NPDC059828 TaxID=3346965 RepID=UPI00365466AA